MISLSNICVLFDSWLEPKWILGIRNDVGHYYLIIKKGKLHYISDGQCCTCLLGSILPSLFSYPISTPASTNVVASGVVYSDSWTFLNSQIAIATSSVIFRVDGDVRIPVVFQFNEIRKNFIVKPSGIIHSPKIIVSFISSHVYTTCNWERTNYIPIGSWSRGQLHLF